MTSLNDTSSAIALLKTRKSASVKAMGEPGPTPEQLKTILEIAVRVPDHGKLTPWRLVLFEGAARQKFGDIIKVRWQKLHPDHGAESLSFQASLFLRAPTVIAVVSKAGLVRTLGDGVSSHALEATIARLRRRLGPAGQAIRSVRSRGYFLDVEVVEADPT